MYLSNRKRPEQIDQVKSIDLSSNFHSRFFCSAILQFEEPGDHLKNSTQLPAELTTNHEELNTSNPTDFNLPSFQAHFSLPPPNVRPTPVEINRCKQKTKATLFFFFILIGNIQLVIIISFMVCITKEGRKEKPIACYV